MVVMASGRWLGVRLDLIASLMTTAVALSAVLVSQDAGRYCANYTNYTKLYQLHQTTTNYTEIQQNTPNYYKLHRTRTKVHQTTTNYSGIPLIRSPM